uniref:NADH-ubiquinone oxidoreductase chain 3 n=1 Tax=Abraeinae sp. MJTNT-2012 TaxID=1227474 RepID=S4SVW4_9COLE|nr:NADH dehydrogenase subunit 3 [Abraeinae sp. MJTNT-2012]
MIKMIMLNSMIIVTISTVMMTMASVLSKKTFKDKEKNSPFECGFDPMNSPRIPFSLHFFLIAVLFLIFDVEITMLIPITQTMKISNIFNYSMMMISFMTILLVGLYHEWKQGALQWKN